MDLLFKRYASPFLLLDGMIATGRMCEFVDKVLELDTQEKEDAVTWEYYLHRVFDKTYQQYLQAIGKAEVPEQDIDFGTTIKTSFDMLKGFSPEG